jgi:hypothetical protein
VCHKRADALQTNFETANQIESGFEEREIRMWKIHLQAAVILLLLGVLDAGGELVGIEVEKLEHCCFFGQKTAFGPSPKSPGRPIRGVWANRRRPGLEDPGRPAAS